VVKAIPALAVARENMVTPLNYSCRNSIVVKIEALESKAFVVNHVIRYADCEESNSAIFDWLLTRGLRFDRRLFERRV
jgi:hypothetical protein